ncbi:MAG: hypothetical protein K6T83_10715 [Alicyclobacillus sp.]|nr:hypothetical protein [Alicyclobacillus sp.]
MAHPLYGHALRLVGKPVYAHHIRGRSYHGILQSVAPHGIYMTLHGPGMRLMSGDAVNMEHAIDAQLAMTGQSADAELVYSPGAYFAFGALTGLTLGALASPWWW